MPRARVSRASLTASADTLILPWLAPRACAESPAVGRLERRDAKSVPAQKEQAQHSAGRTIRSPHGRPSRSRWQSSPKSARPSQPSSSTGASCRISTRPGSLDLRYVDIASFARRHLRSYASSTDQGKVTFNQTHPLDKDRAIADDVSSGTRYSRRRSWKEQVAKQAEGLSFAEAGRRRVKLIAQAEERLNAHARRLQRDRRNYRNKLIYDGQYRSLRRFILGLKRWDHTVADVSKHSKAYTDDEHWLLHTFAALDRSAYPHVNALTKPITLEHDPRCQVYTEQLLEGVERDGPGRIWTNWHMFQEKQKYYDTVLVYMLERKPGYAQDLMSVVALDNELPQTKFIVLADALAHLAKLHLKEQYPSGQGWQATPTANIRKFTTTFINCTEKVDAAVFSQDLLYSLVLLADIPDLKRVYDALIEARTRLTIATVLHYAAAFAEAGEFRYALQCLERRLALFNNTDREALVATDNFRWTCAAILRGSMRQAKNYHETPSIVAKFVEFGVKMDLLLYDVVMHNAMDAGDFATAFKVFNALEDNGLKADKYTFSILLHGCTAQNDPAMFRAFADFCLKKAKELEDPWLATDYLYYIYICQQSKPVASRDATLVWRTYLDLFDLAPLDALSRFGSRAMKDAIDQAASAFDPGRKKLAPTEQALYLMLQTEIQAIQPLSIGYLERLYRSFKRIISLQTPDPTLLSLAQKPVIWNAFLHAFCTKQQYASASALIKDMTAHGTTSNVYSWNMFMQSFFKTGQVAAAERVFELMRVRGIDPDSYTYGVMARGYAKAQLVDRIGETMQHISEEEQLDPDLIHALGRVQRRADLTASLEKNRLAKEQKDADAAEQRAKEEEDRFKVPGLRSLFAKAVTFREPTHWDHGSLEDADDFLEPDDEPSAVQEVNPEGDSTNSVTDRILLSEDPTSHQDRGEDANDYLEPQDEPATTRSQNSRTELKQSEVKTSDVQDSSQPADLLR